MTIVYTPGVEIREKKLRSSFDQLFDRHRHLLGIPVIREIAIQITNCIAVYPFLGSKLHRYTIYFDPCTLFHMYITQITGSIVMNTNLT